MAHDKLLFTPGEFDDVIGKPLRTFANRPIVDGVRSDWVHAAAPPTGAKRNDGPEHIIEFLPMVVPNVIDHLLAVLGISILGQPRADVLFRRWT